MTPGAATEPVPPTRCFLALLPDAASRQALEHCREPVERSSAGAAHGVRFIDPAALHMTLRFLGDSTRAQVEYLKHVLPGLAPALPALAVRRLAIWPNRARPRLLVLELATDAALSSLVHDCETHAHKAGYELEPHGFRAHVTLARLRPGCAFGTLPNPSTSIAFDSVALLQSTLAQPAAAYTELAREPLAST